MNENTPFKTEDIHEYLSRCNLRSHDLHSYMYTQSMIWQVRILKHYELKFIATA